MNDAGIASGGFEGGAPGALEAAGLPGARADAKPLLRGVIHKWAAVVAAGAGTVLVAMAPSARSAGAAAVYALSLITLFTISATYHRLAWGPEGRQRMRRLDHSAIFVLIAGSYTPVALVALGPGAGTRLCVLAWAAAGVGIVKSLVWSHSPKFVTALVAVAVGWCVVPYLGDLARALVAVELGLIFGAAFFYTVGAVAYATKRPNPVRGVFGYHEVFHACTVIAAALHFACVVLILRRSAG